MCFKCESAQQYVSDGVDSTGADVFCMDVAVRQATQRISCYDFNAGVAFGAFVCAVAATTFNAMLLILSETSSATCQYDDNACALTSS